LAEINSKNIIVIKFVIKYANILLQYIMPFTADEVNFSKYTSRISVLPEEGYKNSRNMTE
jgi:hypothetical protein